MYFAKSGKKALTVAEKDEIRLKLSNLLEILEEDLTEKEKDVLKNAIKNVEQSTYVAPQSLEEHTEDIVRCAEHFFEQYGNYFTEKEQRLVIEACLWHDVGKINELFQVLVNPTSRKKERQYFKQIPHGFLSALAISQKDFLSKFPDRTKEDFKAFFTAIYYHHAREDDYTDTEIKEYCEKYYNDSVKEYLKKENWKLHMLNRRCRLFINNSTAENKPVPTALWNPYLVIKGLLNRFDWSVSAGYSEAETYSDMSEKKLKKEVLKKRGENLRPAQKFMEQNMDKNLVIIAPTGSGKTEAALLWMNGEKGFYTLPLKVSSNAIYKRIKEEYAYEQAALLHSDSVQKYLEESTEDRSGFENYERAKLLSASLTICTVDQLFKFVYQALGTEMVPATLKYSKLIIDEIQAYSPRVVATIIYGLKTIQELGGHFAIITATFPPVLKYFMEKYGLSQGKEYLYKDFSGQASVARHRIQIIYQDFDVAEIIHQGEKKKVLIICNTVTKAQKVYEQIAERTENVWLLHSRFLRCDRAVLEEEIMKFSTAEHRVGIWITTQIVEASLDIDFDLLYTEMCTGDSLLQRMGRCNRAGRYVPEKANVIVHVNGNGIGDKSVYAKDLCEISLKYLEEYEGCLFTESMKSEYIQKSYSLEEVKDTQYFNKIDECLNHFDTIGPCDYSKEETEEEFRQINSLTVVPDSVYGENRNIFETCNYFLKQPHIGSDVRSVLRTKLDSLTLSISLHNRWPDGIDRSASRGEHIHGASLKYEFDRESMRGRGLLLERSETEDCIL